MRHRTDVPVSRDLARNGPILRSVPGGRLQLPALWRSADRPSVGTKCGCCGDGRRHEPWRARCHDLGCLRRRRAGWRNRAGGNASRRDPEQQFAGGNLLRRPTALRQRLPPVHVCQRQSGACLRFRAATGIGRDTGLEHSPAACRRAACAPAWRCQARLKRRSCRLGHNSRARARQSGTAAAARGAAIAAAIGPRQLSRCCSLVRPITARQTAHDDRPLSASRT